MHEIRKPSPRRGAPGPGATHRHRWALRRGAARLAAALLLALAGLAFAQDQAHRNYYRGTIGDEPWQLELSIDGGSVRGRLTHDTQPLQLELGGRYDESDDSLILRFGVPGGELSGTLFGEPDEAGVFEGRSLGKDGLQPFRFDQVAHYVDFSFRQGPISATSTYPFFTSQRMAGMNEFVQPDLLAAQLEFVQLAQEADIRGEIRFEWWFDSWVTIEYATPGLLSMLVSVNQYTGGAHPNTYYRAYNLAYVGTRLRPFELGDLFLDDSPYLDELNRIIVSSLRAQEGSWFADGSTDRLAEDELQVFTLSPGGLQFVFAPYAVGPYVAGTFTTHVPLEAVAHLLDPAGPAGRVLPGRD